MMVVELLLVAVAVAVFVEEVLGSMDARGGTDTRPAVCSRRSTL